MKLTMTVDYTELGKIQYLLGQRGLAAQDEVYAQNVKLAVLVPETEVLKLKEILTEETSGRILWEGEEKCGIGRRGGKWREL